MGGVAAVLIINLTHISPWVATLGAKSAGHRRALRPGGKLIIYGPFKIDGRHTSEGNATFDESLRGQNPDWGYRDVEAVVAMSEDCGLRKLDVVEMPANNLTLVLCKRRLNVVFITPSLSRSHAPRGDEKPNDDGLHAKEARGTGAEERPALL